MSHLNKSTVESVSLGPLHTCVFHFWIHSMHNRNWPHSSAFLSIRYVNSVILPTFYAFCFFSQFRMQTISVSINIKHLHFKLFCSGGKLKHKNLQLSHRVTRFFSLHPHKFPRREITQTDFELLRHTNKLHWIWSFKSNLFENHTTDIVWESLTNNVARVHFNRIRMHGTDWTMRVVVERIKHPFCYALKFRCGAAIA